MKIIFRRKIQAELMTLHQFLKEAIQAVIPADMRLIHQKMMVKKSDQGLIPQAQAMKNKKLFRLNQ